MGSGTKQTFICYSFGRSYFMIFKSEGIYIYEYETAHLLVTFSKSFNSLSVMFCKVILSGSPAVFRGSILSAKG